MRQLFCLYLLFCAACMLKRKVLDTHDWNNLNWQFSFYRVKARMLLQYFIIAWYELPKYIQLVISIKQ